MRRTTNLALCVAAAVCAIPAPAQILQENFDNVTGLAKAGWVFQNNSDPHPATNGDWAQGDTSVFYDQSGFSASYVSSSFTAVGDPSGTISNWLLTPAVSLTNGDTLQFYTRTVDALAFPDRLEVRLALSGGSANVGTSAVSVGDFSDLLLTVNPGLKTGAANYPTDWTPYTITLSGLPSSGATGRIGFRHFVTDAGTYGANGNFIGVDSLSITAAPEPSAFALLLCGASVGLFFSRRRRG